MKILITLILLGGAAAGWYVVEGPGKAEAAGGQLVSIGSQEENTFVHNLTITVPASVPSLFQSSLP